MLGYDSLPQKKKFRDDTTDPNIFIYTTFAFGDDLGVGFFVSDVSALGFTLDVIVTLLKLILL